MTFTYPAVLLLLAIPALLLWALPFRAVFRGLAQPEDKDNPDR